MKYTDNFLVIAAGYSLFTIAVIFSNRWFAGINHLIPDIFSDSASITLGQTFHQVIGAIVTGMFLVRFRAKPVLVAFIIAVAVNIESYILVLQQNPSMTSYSYYSGNHEALLMFIKPLAILPIVTFLVSLVKRIEPPEEQFFEED